MSGTSSDPAVPWTVPPALQAGVDTALAALGADIPSRCLGLLPRVLACSPYAADCLARYPGILTALDGAGRLERANRPGEFAALLAGEAPVDLAEEEFQRQLRLFRHRELVRIVWRDLAGAADVTETLEDLSALADAAIDHALAWSVRFLSDRYGQARDEDGGDCSLGVLAMGKLGGRELNFSSDVDLVLVYTAGGETTGPRQVSNEEYFRLLSQRLIDILDRKTPDGFVYRVDVRLRPFGSAGPLAVSATALENYLVRHGREWERYAYIKARVVNDWPGADALYHDVIRPFVYRRYLDYGVFGSLREMKAMIEAEGERKEYGDNLKLGPGGIREIEFIVQALQLVRGGSIGELRERRLLTALGRLTRHGCLPAADAAGLEAAYRFLRLAENRLQAIADRQTHDLPDDVTDRLRLAFAMGCADWPVFLAALQVHRDTVRRCFREVVFRGGSPAGESSSGTVPGDLAAIWQGSLAAEEAVARLAALGFAAPEDALRSLHQLREGGARRLGEAGRQRLDVLMPAIIAAAGRQPGPGRALEGMVRVIEAIGRRSAYFALLNENPAALERLVTLCGSSDFLSRQIAAHPLLLDELIDPRVFSGAPDRAELAEDLATRLRAAPEDDPEARLEALRNFQQAATFRVAVVDLSGVLPLMKVSDRLTDIAELVLDAALSIAWGELVSRHGEPRCTVDGLSRPARFAIVAYGKLGGLELGYGSDLDLVFLNDSTGDDEETVGPRVVDNAMFFSSLTRRIISILTMHTTTGKLYEVDIRLRPSGRSGLLVSSLTAFDRYQREDAWTWEHQALLRSRAVAGDAGVRQAFEALRVHALTRYVRRERLREEVADMRGRMRAELAQGTAELLDLKQDPGGITDIEFLVQYLVLREAAAHPELVHWSDNIRQLEALAACGILPADEAEALADAYRTYRQRIHRQNLAGDPGLAPRAEFSGLTALVGGLWQQVFG